ncbi:MAG: NAD(P)H-dependent oxidoreductase [Propionibacterium sp.]|nr:NAD(P)H-dependent oxidoreductase [Propionibacterium sp.]
MSDVTTQAAPTGASDAVVTSTGATISGVDTAGGALSVVILNGSPSEASKTVTLAQLAADTAASRFPTHLTRVDVYGLGPDLTSAVTRSQVGQLAEAALTAVESADLLLVAVPTFRGSYPGIFKHFVDLLDLYGVAGTPTVLMATGGSERHSLMIDHELRPLFAFLQAFVAPSGIYVASESFDGTAILDPRVHSRIQVSIDDLTPLLQARLSARAGDSAA